MFFSRRHNVLKKYIVPRIQITIQYILYGLEEREREDMYRIKLIKLKRVKVQDKRKTVLESPEEEEEVVEMSEPLSVSQIITDSLQLLSTYADSTDMIEVLKKNLSDVILLSKVFLEKAAGSVSLEDLLEACEEVKTQCVKLFKTEVPAVEIDNRIKSRLDHLKKHLDEVIKVSKDLQNDKFLSPSVENFPRICEEVCSKINIYMKKIESPPVTDTTSCQLCDLKSKDKTAVKITEDCKEQGTLTPDVENIPSGIEVKFKIDLITKEVEIHRKKLDHSKTHLKYIEETSTQVKQEGLTSSSIENFLTSCKELKDILGDCKNREKKHPDNGLQKLVSQLDETICLSKEAMEFGLVSESVEEFIESCEGIKKKLEMQGQGKKTKPKHAHVLEEFEHDIEDVIKMVNKCQAEGEVTKSISNFIKLLEMTKAETHENISCPHNESEFRIVYPSCSDACTCGDLNMASDELCHQCEEQLKTSSFAGYISPPPCDTCRDREIKNYASEDVLKLANSEQWPEYVSPEHTEDLPRICELCKKYMQDEIEDSKSSTKAIEKVKPKQPPPAKRNFDKKVWKITKVTRTQNTDGMIREEKETITMREEIHNPTETSVSDDDDDFLCETSHESVLEETNIKKVATCMTPEQNKSGFLRNTRSECCWRMTPMAVPTLRQCISITDLRF